MNKVKHPHFKPQALGSIAESAVQILRQGLGMLTLVSLEHYGTKVPLAFNATMGGHYRHCLEHFQILLNGMHSGVVNYDARDRNEKIEEDILFAKQVTMDLIDRLYEVQDDQLDITLSVLSQTHYEIADHQKAESTLKRELMYGVAHAIHHYALIAVMAGYLKVELPEDFGVAPSTLHYRSRLTIDTMAPKVVSA
ncbi:MAG: hypothetical protein HOH33_09330 [Verrucomicrobia bacterium]|nr:hypothetical protein [Verrucomicrobiota bacterium]